MGQFDDPNVIFLEGVVTKSKSIYLGLLRFFQTIGGGLGGQIFNFPLECSMTSWQGSFVVVEKLLSTPMSI